MGLFDKFKKKANENTNFESNASKGFKFLDKLIHSRAKEISLDCDIELKLELLNNEEKVYLEGIPLNVDNLVIDGNGHSIDAKGKARIFNCTGKNITLKNLTFKNGSARAGNDYGEGGAIILNDGSINIFKSSFTDNRSDGRGGAVACFYGELNIKDSTFSNNAAANDSGGAVCIYGGILNMSDSRFYKNSAEKAGALDLSNVDFTIEKCTFSDNKAKSAGALDNSGPNPLAPTPIFYDSVCDIKESVFENNSAEEYGAISSSKMLNIYDSKIISNTCDDEYVIHFRDNVKIINCKISNNESQKAIINNEDSLQIYGSDFKDNISKNYIIDNDSNLSIFNTNFIENKVDDAVIYNNGEHCIVENGTFENNLSHGDAKNIYNDGELTLKNPKINDENKTIFNDSWGHILIKNSPPNLSDKIDGDGEVVVENSMIPKVKTFDFGHLDRIIHKSNEKEIFLEDDILFENYEKEYYEGGIELDIDDLVIDGNGKTIDGDGKSRIFTVTGKNITLKNITFKNGKSHKNYDNKLNNHGGVLRITKGANLTVKNCKFLNNTSEEYGGAISNSGELNICESQISHNISKSHGGAIFNYHGKLKLSKSVLSDNDGNKKGGAIYNVYADLKMTNSMLSENSVTGSGGGGIGSYGLGGAIYSEDSDMDISESTLSNNYAASEGGAIYNSEGNLLMRKSTISKNKVGNSNFSGAVHSSEKGIDKIFKFITQEIGARSVSNTEYFNVDEIGNHILKGINLKDCTFKENDPYDLAIGAISHEYLNEFSSQLGYSVYDKVMLERND